MSDKKEEMREKVLSCASCKFSIKRRGDDGEIESLLCSPSFLGPAAPPGAPDAKSTPVHRSMLCGFYQPVPLTPVSRDIYNGALDDLLRAEEDRTMHYTELLATRIAVKEQNRQLMWDCLERIQELKKLSSKVLTDMDCKL